MKNQGHLDIVKLTLKLTLNEVLCWLLSTNTSQFQFNIVYFKIFNGTTKLVPVECRPQISNSKSSQMQVVRIHVPCGFPTGKILKTEVSKIVAGFEEIKSIL